MDANEVEAALRAHPNVADASVVGIADEEWGERVVAAVVGAAPDESPEGSSAQGQGMPAVLDAWCRGRLSAAKVPREWRFPSSIPLNERGKVDRARVRALFG